MNFFNLCRITTIIKGISHNGFRGFNRPNPTIKTNNNNSFIYILNNNIMIFELWCCVSISIEILTVEFACNLHANAQAQKNHEPRSLARGHKLITYFVISLSMRSIVALSRATRSRSMLSILSITSSSVLKKALILVP